MTNILIVDDDQGIRNTLEMVLLYEDYHVDKAANGKDALKFLKKKSDIDVALVDIKMPGMDGLELLEIIKKDFGDIEVIVISGNAEIPIAVDATKKGAFDFLAKPLDQDRVLITIRNALKKKKLSRQCKELSEIVNDDPQILGNSKAILDILDTVERVAPTEAKVLITGENGTGKELIAQAIHYQSVRKEASFVEVNCAAIPESLIESELFGHEKGAFTHAHEKRKGKFELANKGSLFLDEIGDMSLTAQAKVLRVLEEGKITRVGGSTQIDVDVRVIAATNKNLAEESIEGTFRQDLYYRLNVVPIHLPPLRERLSDIPLIANFFLDRFVKKYKLPAKTLEESAIKSLQSYSWPGNIRELRNLIERAVILAKSSSITKKDINLYTNDTSSNDSMFNSETFEDFKKVSEKAFLSQKLEETNWNVKKTAEILKMQRSNLYKKMEKYNLNKPN
ncbi:sigma-54-dependent transcriptional regulator [Candidatus Uabimicrobium amorphum]|uniref:Sigma-54-dependent Fis family transcriptional regulator n=1 Tax=Uabimicrobium amorphum TaxID=2596890 RepID=A0A5S9IJF5_UABAM|nr:sigma-54 dependent transcriptional regulator [Candidatus Uabimicrobium amorphum]BBM82963.1 sigma-54-dependent Fis family transcriptional regulator [Candidatus Uabimicrobium amorphum]